MALISSRAVALAIVGYLDGTSGISAYLSEGPKPPAGKTVVVHPSTGQFEGSLGDPWRDRCLEFQTTSIGVSPEQALWVHDQVTAALLRAVLTGTGFTTLPIHVVAGSEQPVRRDDQLAEPIFIATCSWEATAQP